MDWRAYFGYGPTNAVDMENLKRRYRRKALLTHPDKRPNKDAATEEFKRLQAVYARAANQVRMMTEGRQPPPPYRPPPPQYQPPPPPPPRQPPPPPPPRQPPPRQPPPPPRRPTPPIDKFNGVLPSSFRIEPMVHLVRAFVEYSTQKWWLPRYMKKTFDLRPDSDTHLHVQNTGSSVVKKFSLTLKWKNTRFIAYFAIDEKSDPDFLLMKTTRVIEMLPPQETAEYKRFSSAVKSHLGNITTMYNLRPLRVPESIREHREKQKRKKSQAA